MTHPFPSRRSSDLPADIGAIAHLALVGVDSNQRLITVIEQLAGEDAGMPNAGTRSRSAAVLLQLLLNRVPHLLFDDSRMQTRIGGLSVTNEIGRAHV